MTFGMAALMGIMSVVPAFAGSVDVTANKGDAKVAFEALKDTEDSVDDADYWEALDGTFEAQDNARQTEVGVQQAMSYTVTIPSFISLDGSKAGTGEGNFNVTVDGDIAGTSKITVTPDLSAATEGVANGTVYESFADGEGTFPLKEDGGIKKDLKATITLADTDWTLATDANEEFVLTGAKTVHAGKVKAEGIKAGTYRNTIDFDVAYENSQAPVVVNP